MIKSIKNLQKAYLNLKQTVFKELRTMTFSYCSKIVA
jgi:hypothetical protein